MSKYNDELTIAGVRIVAKGLHPSSNAICFPFSILGEEPVVTYGSYADSEDLAYGFILIDEKLREEALKWLNGCHIQ